MGPNREIRGLSPRPRVWRPGTGFFPFSAPVGLRRSTDTVVRAELAALARRLSTVTGARIGPPATSPERPCISAFIIPRLPEIGFQAEGYRIAISPREIRIEACSDRGIFYAGITLVDLLRDRPGSWIVPCGEIRDWPESSWRGFLIDPARKFIPVSRILRYLDWMAENKMNVLHVHFTDNEQFTIETPQWPLLNERLYSGQCFSPGIGLHPFTAREVRDIERGCAGVYSRSDIRTIVAHAAERKIDIVPELSAPSHSAPLLKLFPELLCHTGTPVSSGSRHRPSETILCIGNPKTYRILESLVDQIAPLFPAKHFHIGSDEIDCLPVDPMCRQSWHRCSVCRFALERRKFPTVRHLFYHYVRRVRAMLKEHGKTVVMWNDYVDIARPVPLPRDIVIHFWRIADKSWPIGPRKGCSLARFAREGFSVINSHFPETYLDGLIRDRRLAAWNPAKSPPVPPAHRDRILGGELCAWADHPFYPYAVPTVLPLFADRVWNPRPVEDLAGYSRTLTRHIFGPHLVPDLEHIFEVLGSIVSPLKAGTRVFPPEERVLAPPAGWRGNGLRRTRRAAAAQMRVHETANRDVLAELSRSLEDMKQ